MADLRFAAPNPENSFSTIAKTMLLVLAATNQRAKISEWAVSYIGTSNTAQPIRSEIYNGVTSLGVGTGITFVKDNLSDAETIQTTGNNNLSSEPTGTKSILRTEEVHPQQGYTWQAPFGGEYRVQGGTRFGFQVTAAAGTSCGALFRMEE